MNIPSNLDIHEGMGASDQDRNSIDQKLLVLAEFYIKKGQFEIAKEFLSKLRQPFQSSYALYLLGKTEFKLKNRQLAINHLERAREMNPLHKPTLLLLYAAYERQSKPMKALECIIDLFLLSKEMNDKYVNRYKNKVRDLAEKVDPPIDQKQKNNLVRIRNQHLNKVLTILEEQTIKAASLIEVPHLASTDEAIQLEFTSIGNALTGSIELPPLPPNFLSPSSPPAPNVVPNPNLADLNADAADVEDTLKMREDEIQPDSEEAFRNEAIRDISGVRHIPPPNEHAFSDTQPRVMSIDDVFYESEKTDSVSDVISISKPRPLFKDHAFANHLVFRTLDEGSIEKIEKFARVKSLQPGEILHHPLDMIDGFSCLLSGRVQILHQQKPLLDLEAGSIIDEAEFNIGSKYFFEVRAMELSQIVVIDKPSFLTLCKRQHDLAYHFLWHFYKSLSLKINSLIDRIISSDVEEEVLWRMDMLEEASQHRSISALEQHVLEKRFAKRTLSRGEDLFKYQDVADHFYILLEGRIDLSHPDSGDFMTIQPLEYFSEISLISNSYEHMLHAKVDSESATLLVVDREQLTALFDRSKGDEYRIIELLWKILSWKYFEFLNFYFHHGRPPKRNSEAVPLNPFARI